jgi:hypothetical protein
MNNQTTDNHRKRRRFAPLIWVSGGLAAVLMVLGVSGTLSDWTSAVISNDSNSAGTTSSVVLEETGVDGAGAAATCTTANTVDNTYTCSQINKYGDGGALDTTLAPGDSISSTVTLANTGSGDASTFTMIPGPCTSEYNTGVHVGNPPASGDDLCGQLQVAVACTGDATLTVAATSLATFAATHTLATGLASGETTSCEFTVSLPSTTPSNYSGQTVTQGIDWTISV